MPFSAGNVEVSVTKSGGVQEGTEMLNGEIETPWLFFGIPVQVSTDIPEGMIVLRRPATKELPCALCGK